MKRAVHLDFHTSEHIPEVGADFCAEEFAETLARARVDSVTLFSRCHHGWLYYDSKSEPEAVHPGLWRRDLLERQIDVCHAAGIRAPIYTTVQWDARIAARHPEWMARTPEGELVDSQNVPLPHFYHHICLNSPYRDYLFRHVRDLIDSLGAGRVDGLFFDILFPVDCSCPHCVSGMKSLGLSTDDARQRRHYARRTIDEFRAQMASLVRSLVPGASIFFNSSTIHPADRNACLTNSHLEIESLPSGGWGYDHFAISSRYARTLGLPAVGMTGRFHTYWGDFHSLKNFDALCFEVFRMLAMGASCCVGDQLHPRGRLSRATYERIGRVYEIVERFEPLFEGASPFADTAIVWNNDAPVGYEAVTGAMKMLQELSCQFDIVDSDADLERYRLIVLPDETLLDEKIAASLTRYRGSIIASNAALSPYSAETAESTGTGGPSASLFRELFGAEDLGDSEYSRDFVMPTDAIGRKLPREEHVMYIGGRRIWPIEAAVLADRIAPYFDRGGEMFTSHQHAPSSGIVCGTAAIRRGSAIYFAHPIFRIYRKNAAKWCRDFFADALDALVPRRVVSHDGPSSLIVSLHRRLRGGVPAHGSRQDRVAGLPDRLLIHLLHYIPEKRSADIHTIADRLPLHDLSVETDLAAAGVSAAEIPGAKDAAARIARVHHAFAETEEIALHVADGIARFTVGRLDGYAVVEIEILPSGRS